MEFFSFAIIMLSILLCSLGGWYLVGLIPHDTLELQITKAFQAGDYPRVLALFNGSKKKYFSDLILLTYGRSLARVGDYGKALGIYNQLSSRLKKDNTLLPILYQEQGDIYLKNQEYTAAQGSYMMGLEASPNNPSLRYKQASSLFQAGDYIQARLILRGLLKENPMLADARLLYADTLANLGFYDKAIQHYGMMDRAGEKIVSYSYAKTLKALKMTDRAIVAYRALLKSTVDAHRKTEMILDCARLYTESRQFGEAEFFIQQYLPSLRGEDHLEMRYIRACIHLRRGDEYTALQEFSLLHEEAPGYKDLNLIMQRGEGVLEIPFLKNYFTSDAVGFENVITDTLSAGATVTKRSPDFYVFSAGLRAHAFYRHYTPAPNGILDEIDRHFPQYCKRANILEFWAFSGFAEPIAKVSRGEYAIKIRMGKDFASLAQKYTQESDYLRNFKQ